MTAVDLGSLLYRTQARLEAAPPSTVAETRAVAVDPLLEALGWAVHGQSVTADVILGDVQFAYLCSVSDTPAFGVAIEAYTDPLEDERWQAVLEELSAAGVPAALYTNGRAVRFRTGNDVIEGELLEFADPDSPLERLVPTTVSDHLGNSNRDRVAVRLATRRDQLVDELTSDLVAIGGHELQGVLERGATEFVDRLVEALSGRADVETVEYSEPAVVNEPEEVVKSPFGVTPEEPDGEYVAKFFDGPTRVGGVGDSTSVGALVGAAEFLLERGLSGAELPWPPNGEEVILHREPVATDGADMEAARTLSNELVLNVGGSVTDRQRRLEALADRAGLRVMLTGDWKTGSEPK